MFAYLFLFSIIFIASILEYFDKKNKIIAFLIFLFLGVIAGSRLDIGGYDYLQYKILFEDTPNSIYSIFKGYAPISIYRMEMGYVYSNAIFKLISENFNLFLLFLGVVSSIFLYVIFQKFSKYIYLSLLIFVSKFYLYYFFTAQRQIIAMLICWLGIYFIIKRKLLYFILIVILASTFHTSAIVFLPAYFLFNLRIKKQNVFLILFCAIFVAVVNGGKIIGLTTGKILENDKALIYFENASNATNLLNFIELLPLFFIAISKRDALEKKIKYYNLFINFFIFYTVTYIAFYQYNFIVRITSYYLLGYVFIVPVLLSLIKSKRDAFGVVIFLSLYYFIIYVRYILTFSGGEGVFPYSSFLLQ